MTYEEFTKGLILSATARANAELYTIPFINEVQETLGDKIRVSSTVRTAAKNKAVGGVANSKHLDTRALAVDFVPVRWEKSITDIVKRIAKKHSFGYLEHDVSTGNHIHCELRTSADSQKKTANRR